MKKFFVVAAMLMSFISGCSSSTPAPAEDPNNPNSGNGTPAATYTISGTITGAAAASATVTLSGTASGETTTDAEGKYSFSSLAAGDYTVTPSKDNSAFNPASLSVTLSANSTADFASAAHQSTSIVSSTDGTVNECDGGDLGTDTTGRVGKEASVGDCDFADRLYRTFFNFDLATAGIGTSAVIVTSTLSFGQALTLGNPYTGNSLTIDHINYGNALMTDAWGTTALTSAVATNTTATAGVVTISTDLKDAVQSDVSVRRRTQFRLSFPDAIAAGNYITIERGAGAANPPTLNVTYYQY